MEMKPTIVRVLDPMSDSEIFFELDYSQISQNEDGMDVLTLVPKKRDKYPIYNIDPLQAKRMNNEDFLNWFNYKIQNIF